MNAPVIPSQMTPFDQQAAADLFRKAPHDYIAVDTGELAYRTVGTGPDVLFVHGWPVTGATFRQLIPYLSQHVTCHFIDMVGAGDSRFEIGQELSVAKNIEHVRHVVDHLNLSDVALVGHDSGGMIARYAMAGDSRLRSMALIDTEQPQGVNWKFKQFISMRHIPGVEHALAWAVTKPRLRRLSLLLGECFTDNSLLDGEFEEFFLKPLYDNKNRRKGAGEVLRSFDMSLIHNLQQAHNEIKVPVKWVCGENDPFFPLQWSKEIVNTFENASVHIVPNAKLFCHEEKPEEVANAILPTLVG